MVVAESPQVNQSLACGGAFFHRMLIFGPEGICRCGKAVRPQKKTCAPYRAHVWPEANDVRLDPRLLAAGRLVLDEFDADEARRIAADLGLDFLVDEVVLGRDLVFRASDLVAFGGIAGVGVGAVAGLGRRTEAHERDFIGGVRRRRAPADETEQALDFILGADRIGRNGELLVDDVLGDARLAAGIAAVVLVDGDAAGGERREGDEHEFLHVEGVPFS